MLTGNSDFQQAMADLHTERPITHVITIPVGMIDPQATQSDLSLLLSRAITGILTGACAANLVPAYIGQPAITPAKAPTYVEIVDPSGKVSYRRMSDHPDVQEALTRPGYSVRKAES